MTEGNAQLFAKTFRHSFAFPTGQKVTWLIAWTSHQSYVPTGRTDLPAEQQIHIAVDNTCISLGSTRSSAATDARDDGSGATALLVILPQSAGVVGGVCDNRGGGWDMLLGLQLFLADETSKRWRRWWWRQWWFRCGNQRYCCGRDCVILILILTKGQQSCITFERHFTASGNRATAIA